MPVDVPRKHFRTQWTWHASRSRRLRRGRNRDHGHAGGGLALRRREASAESPSGGAANRPFLQGFLTNASNLKAPLLFLSLLPQFVSSGAPVVPWTLLLSVIAVSIGLIWFSTVAILIDRIAGFFSGGSTGRTVDIVTGVVLLALGAALMAEAMGDRL